MTNQTVACWELADASLSMVAPAGAFLQVSAGYHHTCGIRTDRTLTCWGSPGYVSAAPPGTFVQVESLDHFTGYDCALRTDGAMSCWSSTGHFDRPGPFIHLSTADRLQCGVTAGGTIDCGPIPFSPPVGVFTHVSAYQPMWCSSSSTCPSSYVCGRRTDGVVACSGYNQFGVAPTIVSPFRQLTGTTAAGDFDGDGRADPAVYRPSESGWYIAKSGGGATGVQWGIPGDVPVPADYDGDGKTDVAVFRPSDGGWFILKSTGGGAGLRWGTAGDIPVPADYDGDGRADVAVFRPSSGAWYVVGSAGVTYGLAWGAPGDVAVPADYDGDGRADAAVFRQADGAWYILKSAGGAVATRLGTVGDAPLPGDYVGDGTAAVAVFRDSGHWWGAWQSFWGTRGDFPTYGDFDGDGKDDQVVFREAEGTWYIVKSSGGSFAIRWGTVGDLPM